MEGFTAEERAKIEGGIRAKYVKVADTPEGSFRYPTGRKGLEALGYRQDLLDALPESIIASYCGVGNIFKMESIKPGETILDVGCGGGVDAIIAAVLVGSRGTVTGADLVPEMVERARTNAAQVKISNVFFDQGSAESLPFPAEKFSAVISNGTFNLVPDKEKGLKEVFRVLKPGGRFLIADQVLTIQAAQDKAAIIETWAR